MAVWRVQYHCGHWEEIDLPTAEQAAGAQKVADRLHCPACFLTLRREAEEVLVRAHLGTKMRRPRDAKIVGKGGP